MKELNAAFEQHAMEVHNMAGCGWKITSIFGAAFSSLHSFEGSEIQGKKDVRYIKTLKTKMAGRTISISLLGDSSSFKRLFFSSYPCNFSGVYYGKV